MFAVPRQRNNDTESRGAFFIIGFSQTFREWEDTASKRGEKRNYYTVIILPKQTSESMT